MNFGFSYTDLAASQKKVEESLANSNISVGVGNTILSFAFFGVGPSIVAYSVLKVLEENDNTKAVIPFSNPATLPITAMILNRVFNLSAFYLLALGAAYVGFQYLCNSHFPRQTSVMFKNIMWNVSKMFNSFIRRSRYSVQENNSITEYSIFLPDDVTKNNINICWNCTDDKQLCDSFSVYINDLNGSMKNYVDCDVNTVVDINKVIVSFISDGDGNKLIVRIPSRVVQSVLLHIY